VAAGLVGVGGVQSSPGYGAIDVVNGSPDRILSSAVLL